MATIFNPTKAKKQNNNTGIFEVKKYIKRFSIEELETKHEAQRTLDEAWVEEIINNWDERTCTPPVVVIENGVNLVVDGQHRLKAMEELGYTQIDCYLIQGISASEAFLMINNIKPIEDIDKFLQLSKIRHYEKTVLDLFDKYEVKIAVHSNGDSYFSDVEYLWSLEDELNYDALEAALEIIINVVEYDGKISKLLISKLYDLFNEQPIFNKVHEEMMTLKSLYNHESKNNARKTISKMQKSFPKSKIDEEIKKLINK